MLSASEMRDAVNFIKTYRYALETSERIAEHQQNLQHYQNMSNIVGEGLEKDQIKMNGDRIVPSTNKEDFPLVQGHRAAQ